MSSILTVTLSPCVDKNTSVDRLIPDKKLTCSLPKSEPGGGGINVARAIVELGGHVTALYPSGGCTGNFFNQLLVDEQVPSIIVPIENETRENIIVLDTTANCQYRFGMPGAELKVREWQKILTIIEEADGIEFLVASGSLPPGAPNDIFARMAAIARRKEVKFIVDTSGEALKQAAQEGVYLLKPNLSELGSLVNKEQLTPEEVINEAKILINKGACEVMVVSIGAKGAILATKDLTRWFSPPPVTIESTVGAGDSMVAGIVHRLSEDKSIETAVQYGVACGTAATMNPGTELCHKADADRICQEVQISTPLLIEKAAIN